MTLPDTHPIIDLDEHPATSTSPRPYKVRSFGVTDPGEVRPSNEDQFAIVELARTLNVQQTSIPQVTVQYSSNRGHIFIVADGMGGHRGGEVASAISVRTVE